MDWKTIEPVVMAALSGSPIASLAVIAYGVYLIWKMSANHLSHIEKAMERIAAAGEKSAEKLDTIAVDIALLKDRTTR